MKRILSTLALALAGAAGPAAAHFPFVIPGPDNSVASVVMSETLKPDPEVGIALLEGIKLSARDEQGRDVALTPVVAKDAMTVALPGAGLRVVHGRADVGVMQRGTGPAHLLIYYPKTIAGDPFDARATVGAGVPVELVPVRVEGGFKLALRVEGRPAADQEVRLVPPVGDERKLKTNAAGETEAITEPGRYAAWARHWQTAKGEQEGERYEQVRHYATLVMDFAGPASPAPSASPAAPSALDATAAGAKPAATATDARVQPFAKLPQAVASFGAVESAGWVYVYGGHVAERHDYSTASVTGKFARLSLGKPGAWEPLPDGPSVQGMNLVAYEGKVYRAGGMQPRNAPGEEADNYSIGDVARFDPAVGKWEPLPNLPRTRSSHDMVVVGGKLYVIGGWTMGGKDAESKWVDTIDVLDLTVAEPRWTSIPQPFARRALTVTAVGKRIFVIGGFDANDDPQLRVDVLDLSSNAWSQGPAIPGKPINGFSPAAVTVDSAVYLSVGTGEMFKLTADGKEWTPVVKATARIVHRLVTDGRHVYIVGGAAREKMLDLIESVSLANATATSSAK